MQGDKTLRVWLDKTIATESDAAHAEAWKAMTAACPSHTLKIAAPLSVAGTRYNCHAFALNVNNDYTYQQLVTRYSKTLVHSTLVSSEFLQHLIAIGELKPRRSRALKQGDIVVYRRGGKVTHSARVVVDGQLLHSKWGTRELHEHGLWEVPTKYGNATKVMTPPSAASVMVLLRDYLKAQPPKVV